MKSLQTLQTIARGFAAAIIVQDDYLFLSRFTARQLEAYSQTPAFTVSSTHSSGVRLSFQTDGDTISFQCRMPPRVNVLKALVSSTPALIADMQNGTYSKRRGLRRAWLSNSLLSAIKMNTFELVADGKSVSLTRAINGLVEIRFENSDNQLRHVELYFPLLEGAYIKDFEVNGSVIPISDSRPRLLCLGDSITHGCFAEHPSRTYVNLLAESLNMQAINQGVAGCTHMPSHLEGIEDLQKPDLITVAYGTNDWTTVPTLTEIQSNISTYYARLTQAFPGTPIVAITPFWRADMDLIRLCGDFFDIHAIISQEAAAWQQISVINGLDVSPHDPEFFDDAYLHPNELGFAWIARELAKQLQSRWPQVL